MEKYYFAYGSNMNLDQMEERCPDSEFVCVGYIKNYKFVYDGYSITREGAVGNILKDKEGIVWGAIFKISERDEEELNRCEGYPTTYSKNI
ncbi:gamma-glutamylcyclotransferase [Methanothermococcus sp. SCGC AD-155-M21]|nr:gamma-glutamylcyclotransferase [Methanothermococcus sp. SCGC AD-155-M21]